MSRHWAVCLVLLPSTTVSLTTASTACPSSHWLLITLVILNQFLEQTQHILAWSLLHLNCSSRSASKVIYSSLLIVYNTFDWIIKAFSNECPNFSLCCLIPAPIYPQSSRCYNGLVCVWFFHQRTVVRMCALSSSLVYAILSQYEINFIDSKWKSTVT